MTPREFSRWLDRHNMSPGLAADFLNVERRTIDRYLDGTLTISQRTSAACRALDPMKIYRLTPVDPTHNDWRASSHRGVAIVRAQGETLARWHAAAKFHIAARRRSDDEDRPSNPWVQSRRVTVEEEDPTRARPAAGQPGVLMPE